MAWTAPATAVTGDVIPASFWNTNGRDNLNALHDVLSGAAQAFGGLFFPTTDNGLSVQMTGGNPVLNMDTTDYLMYDRAGNVYRFRIGGVDKASIDANQAVFSGRLGTSQSGGTPGGGGFGSLIGNNKSGSGAEINIFNLFTNPATVLDIWGWNGSAWVQVFAVDMGGKISGKGFYDSGQVAVGPGTNVNFAHGLGKRPRFVWGYLSVSPGVVSTDTASASFMPVFNATAAATLLSADSTNILVQNTSGSTTHYCRVFAML